MTSELAIIIGGAVAAGFVQGLSGFAFSLVALSVWAWAVDPQIAAPMAVFGSLMGQLLALPMLWKGIQPRRAAPFILGGSIGVPLGVVLLGVLDPGGFKLGLGIFLLLYSSCDAVRTRQPGAALGRALGRRRDRLDWRSARRHWRACWRRADIVVHVARMGQGHPARRDAGLQYLDARRHAGELCDCRQHDHRTRAAYVRDHHAGAGDPSLARNTGVPPTRSARISARRAGDAVFFRPCAGGVTRGFSVRAGR